MVTLLSVAAVNGQMFRLCFRPKSTDCRRQRGKSATASTVVPLLLLGRQRHHHKQLHVRHCRRSVIGSVAVSCTASTDTSCSEYSKRTVKFGGDQDA